MNLHWQQFTNFDIQKNNDLLMTMFCANKIDLVSVDKLFLLGTSTICTLPRDFVSCIFSYTVVPHLRDCLKSRSLKRGGLRVHKYFTLYGLQMTMCGYSQLESIKYEPSDVRAPLLRDCGLDYCNTQMLVMT